MPNERNRDGTQEAGGPKARDAHSDRPCTQETPQPPISKDWAWLDAISGPLDADMIEAALELSTARLAKNK